MGHEFVPLSALSFSNMFKGIISYDINASNSNDHDDIMSMFDHRSSGKWARKNMPMSNLFYLPQFIGKIIVSVEFLDVYGWTCVWMPEDNCRCCFSGTFILFLGSLIGLVGYINWPANPGKRWDLPTFTSQSSNPDHVPSHTAFLCWFWSLNWGPHACIENSVMAVLSPQPVSSTDCESIITIMTGSFLSIAF